jgi:hypothetical protein
MNWYLVDKDTGVEAQPGQMVDDFRGEEHQLSTGLIGHPPHKTGGTGRIYTEDGQSFLPSVVNLEWIQR